jgi:hypothetical protein
MIAGSAAEVDCREDSKTWNPFLCYRNRKRNDRPFIQCLQQHKVKRDLLDAFLQDTGNTVPSRGAQQAKRILRELLGQTNAQCKPIRAWVECRRKVGDNDRISPEWLGPDEFSRFIKERVGPWSLIQNGMLRSS